MIEIKAGKVVREMSNDEPIVCFKLGERRYMEDLVLRGHVFMNTASYFAALEEDAARRRDPDEGAIMRIPEGSTLSLQTDEGWEVVGTIGQTTTQVSDELRRVNLYCVHARMPSEIDQPFKLDTRFGDTAVVFLNPREFVRRVETAAADQGLQIFHRLVEYVNRRSYMGPMGPFKKFSEFADQREYRIAAVPGIDGPLLLKLGDLSDIARVVASAELFAILQKDSGRLSVGIVGSGRNA